MERHVGIRGSLTMHHLPSAALLVQRLGEHCRLFMTAFCRTHYPCRSRHDIHRYTHRMSAPMTARTHCVSLILYDTYIGRVTIRPQTGALGMEVLVKAALLCCLWNSEVEGRTPAYELANYEGE